MKRQERIETVNGIGRLRVPYRGLRPCMFLLTTMVSVALISGCRTGLADRTNAGDRDEGAGSDVLVQAEDRFAMIMENARDQRLDTLALGNAMQQIGRWLEGTPYQDGLLDAADEETLVTTLDGFDCVLFVESVLALARGVSNRDYARGSYADRIREQRYRGGKMDGYCSRLHYFSEWIRDNATRGLVHDLTRAMGGVPFSKTLTFMTRHRNSYRHMADNDSLFAGVAAVEHMLANVPLYHIPQERIRAAYPLIRAGDIVAISTDIDGLDIAHTGLALVDEDGKVGLLHASSTGSVKESADLHAYVEGNTRQVGIMIARPVDVRLTE